MIIWEKTLHSYYLLHINIASYWKWCLAGPDSPDKQNFNKYKKHGKSESINYTLLNEKRIHDDEKKKVHISCWINNIAYHNLTWLVINNNVWMDLTHQVNTLAILLTYFACQILPALSLILHIIYYLLFSW